VALPVVIHQDALEVRMTSDADAHQVPGLALVPVGGRPDGDNARHRLVLVQVDLDAHAWRTPLEPQQVVGHGKTLRLRLRQALQTPGSGIVQVAPAAPTPVAGYVGSTRFGTWYRGPAQIVHGGHISEKREVQVVAQIEARLDEPGGVDDERRLPMLVDRLDDARDTL